VVADHIAAPPQAPLFSSEREHSARVAEVVRVAAAAAARLHCRCALLVAVDEAVRAHEPHLRAYGAQVKAARQLPTQRGFREAMLIYSDSQGALAVLNNPEGEQVHNRRAWGAQISLGYLRHWGTCRRDGVTCLRLEVHMAVVVARR
jgi:hypothetical protein